MSPVSSLTLLTQPETRHNFSSLHNFILNILNFVPPFEGFGQIKNSDDKTGHCLALRGVKIFSISHHKYFGVDGRHPPATVEFSPRELRTLKRPEILELEASEQEI